MRLVKAILLITCYSGVDKMGSKGTEHMMVQEGTAKGVIIATILAALNVRILSSCKKEREDASKIFADPSVDGVHKQQVIGDLKAALYASNICSYAQGLGLIKATSDEYIAGTALTSPSVSACGWVAASSAAALK